MKRVSLLILAIILVAAAIFFIYRFQQRPPADQSGSADQSNTGQSNQAGKNKANVTIVKAALTSGEERLIILEKTVDLDNDGALEKIILDAIKEDYGLEPGGYNRLRIYEQNGRADELVFDSEQAGITDFYGEYFDNSELLIINDYDLNGFPEIYMIEWAFGSSPSRLAILEKNERRVEMLYLDNMQDFAYADLDDDGVMELHGMTQFGGQVRFNAPQYTAYKRKGNTFIPSYNCTRILITQKLDAAVESFMSNPDYGSADYVIAMFVLAGDKEALRDFLIVNGPTLASIGFFEAEELLNVDLIIEQASEMFEAKAKWLEGLK